MNNIYKPMGFDLSEAICWFFVSFVCFCKIPPHASFIQRPNHVTRH